MFLHWEREWVRDLAKCHRWERRVELTGGGVVEKSMVAWVVVIHRDPGLGGGVRCGRHSLAWVAVLKMGLGSNLTQKLVQELKFLLTLINDPFFLIPKQCGTSNMPPHVWREDIKANTCNKWETVGHNQLGQTLGSILDFINSPLFKLNIPRIRSHLLKKSLSSHVRRILN